MIDTHYLLQVLGSILAILGAICNCSPDCKDKKLGFGIWIISNATLLYWSILVQAYWLSVMYSVFMLTSCYGFWHHRNPK